jgi:hypothetical protein
LTVISEDRLARLADFREVQLSKLNLPANVAKGDWRKLSLPELMALLKGEVEECERALRSRDGIGVAAEYECADVANMAFMLWDKLNGGHV